MRLPILLVLLAGALCCGTERGDAQEWTRFRGPNGSGMGRAPELPATFTERDFRWKVELPGSGHSSPVVWGKRVFVTATSAGTAKRLLLALDADDGHTLWSNSYETAAFRQHSDNSYTSMSPALDAGRVFSWWGSPEGSALVAVAQEDGRELWRCELGPFVSQHGPGASPIVAGELVLLNFDQDEAPSFLLALDARTGAERWRYTHAGTSSSANTPCLLKAADGRTDVILATRTLGVVAVDLATGKPTWQMPGLLTKRCVASPIVTDDGLVIAQCGEGQAESFVYAVRPPVAGGAPQKVYQVIRTGGYVPTPLAVGPLLFLWKENGLVTCLRAATGEQLWSERVDGPFYGSPIAVEGRLYAITRRGELVVLNAGEQFAAIARVPLGEGSFATPALSGSRLFVRTFTHLIAIGK